MDPQSFIENELMAEMIRENVFGANKKLKSIELTRLGADGTFMLTICHRAHVILEDDQNNETEHHIVIKLTPPVDEMGYTGAQFDQLFENEIRAYTEILPTYGSGMESVKYYYSYRKELKACLVLDDFEVFGWKMSKAKYGLSLEHLLQAAKQLGRFHAGGYLLKLTDRKKLDDIISQLQESRYSHDDIHPVWEAICRAGPLRAINSLRETPETAKLVPEEYLQKLEKLMERPHLYGKRMTRPIEPFATICHGDYLRNNIAFRYDDKDVPTNCLTFDYQTLRYASPMIDLCTLMTTACDTKTRVHFDEIFDAYFNEIVEGIKRKTDLPDFVTRENFLKEYAKYYPHAFAIATSFYPVLVEPMAFMFDDMLNSTDEQIDEILELYHNSGGEVVDEHLRGLVVDQYNMGKKCNADIFEE